MFFVCFSLYGFKRKGKRTDKSRTIKKKRERALNKNKDKLAVLCCVESQKFVFKANQSVKVQCQIDHEIMYKPVCAIVQPTESWYIPSFVEIAPAVVQFNNKKHQQ